MSKFTNFLSKIFGSKNNETKVGQKPYEVKSCEKCEPKFNLTPVQETKEVVVEEVKVEQVKVEEQKIQKPILVKKPIQKKNTNQNTEVKGKKK